MDRLNWRGVLKVLVSVVRHLHLLFGLDIDVLEQTAKSFLLTAHASHVAAEGALMRYMRNRQNMTWHILSRVQLPDRRQQESFAVRTLGDR